MCTRTDAAGPNLAELVTVLIFAFLPAGGNLIGGMLAETLRSPQWVVGASLHATAGIAIALVSIDLMPRILASSPMWLIVVSFLAGAFVSVLLARGGRQSWRVSKTAGAGPWMVYMSVVADLVGDGLMVGAGTAVQNQLGLLIAASQSVANIPGGFAAVATFRGEGMQRWRRFTLTAALVPPVLASAGIGFLLLRGAGPMVQDSALAFIVGILLLATVEDVLPQGDKPQPARWISTAAFAAGFSVMALLSAYVY